MINKVPEFLANKDEWLRQIAVAINQIIDGKSNAVGQVTLEALQDNTVVEDLRVGVDSRIYLMPLTSNAASEVSNIYVSDIGKQTFTINHSNNMQIDRNFKYSIIG